MTVSYNLLPEPKWYFVDQSGKPLGAGQLYTFSSLNPTLQKFVYSDPAGMFPYTDPLLIDENGTAGPIYWQFDSTDPTNLYYVEVRTPSTPTNPMGDLIWTIDDFGAPAGGGGGGDITENINLENIITNNIFHFHNNNSANPIGAESYFICPSNNSEFTLTNVPGNLGDTYFFKSNLSATDSISFLPFGVGSTVLTGDITPPVYLEYSCTSAGAGGETFKYVQFPISRDIQSLSSQEFTTTIWARCNSGNNSLTLQLYQFFGNNGDGTFTDTLTPLITIPLTASWAPYSISTTVPDITGASIGQCENTGIYLQVWYPLSQTTNIDIVKPTFYLGAIGGSLLGIDYVTEDVIDSVIQKPRTGDIRISLNSFGMGGWILCDDETIGNPSSNAVARANFDTFPLFDLIWQAFKSNQSLAPMFTSADTPVAYGASSMFDFAANNQIALTKILGRVLASQGMPSTGGTGNSWPIGTAHGEELHILSVPELAPHNHPILIQGAGATLHALNTNAADIPSGSDGTVIQNNGSGVGHNTIQPTAYFNVYIKL